MWIFEEEYETETGRRPHVRDLDTSAVKKIFADCKKFIRDNTDALIATGARAEQNGHDFWLTRNRHGVGFWDRGYPKELGDALTRASQKFGEQSPYVGDSNGKIYLG